MTHLMVITDGRKECIQRTLHSAEQALQPVDTRHILDDSCDPNYGEWLRDQFPEFEVFSFPEKQGFGGAIRQGWARVPESADFVFHLEDDFVFLEQVDLVGMKAILNNFPNVAQVALKRQPWSPEEISAGGFMEMWPDLYKDQENIEMMLRWTEQRQFFTTNPSLYRRELTLNSWPNGQRSEERFSQVLFADPNTCCAFWGYKADSPRVLHIGESRNGTGY